jgi:hypothetical protein
MNLSLFGQLEISDWYLHEDGEAEQDARLRKRVR